MLEVVRGYVKCGFLVVFLVQYQGKREVDAAFCDSAAIVASGVQFSGSCTLVSGFFHFDPPEFPAFRRNGWKHPYAVGYAGLFMDISDHILKLRLLYAEVFQLTGDLESGYDLLFGEVAFIGKTHTLCLRALDQVIVIRLDLLFIEIFLVPGPVAYIAAGDVASFIKRSHRRDLLCCDDNLCRMHHKL